MTGRGRGVVGVHPEGRLELGLQLELGHGEGEDLGAARGVALRLDLEEVALFDVPRAEVKFLTARLFLLRLSCARGDTE